MRNTATFTVNVTETSFGFVEVEATSKDEALEEAEAEYHSGNVIWNKSDFTVQLCEN